jgi:hypothetical protein
MSEYAITIVVAGDDRASGPLQSVGQELRGVGEAADSANTQGGGFFSNLLSTAGGFLAANVVGAITSQVKDFVAGGIADARESAQLLAATETIIRNTGGAAGMSSKQVTDLASALSDAAGASLFGDDQVQGATNVLLKYKELKGIIPGVTTLAVDMAQSLGQAPAQAAEFLGRALQKPFDASAKLAKQGIILTDAQNATIATFEKAGDAAGAQTYLMELLNSSYGGTALAAAKADGGIAELKGRFGEAAETIGAALLPVLGILGNLLLTHVIPPVEKAATWLGENLPSAIATVKGAIGPAIAAFTAMGGSGDLMGGALGDLMGVWAALQPVIVNVVDAVGAVVLAVFGVIQTFMATHGADINASMQDAWTKIMAIVKSGAELYNAIVPPILKAIAAFIGAHGKEIQAILSATWSAVKAVIDIALALIQGVISTALALLKGDWSGAWEEIKTMCATIVTGMITILQTNLDILKTVFGGAITWIKDEWDKLPGKLSNVGGDIVKAIKKGIEDEWSRLTKWFNDKLQELRDKLPFSEPKDAASPMYGLGKSGQSIVRNLQDGIGSAPALAISAPRMPSGVSGARATSIGVSAGVTNVFHIDARGSRMSQQQFEQSVRRVLDTSGAQALSRIRTGN